MIRELFDTRNSVASNEWLVYDENCRNTEVEDPVAASEADVAIGSSGSIEEVKANVVAVDTLVDKLAGFDIKSEEVNLKENSHEKKGTKNGFGAVGDRCNNKSFRRGYDTVILHHPACVLPNVNGHCEAPGRVTSILAGIKRHFPQIDIELSPKATRRTCELFHTSEHVDNILQVCEKSNTLHSTKQECTISLDEDTIVTPFTEEAALRAVGAACRAVDLVLSGEKQNAFCCIRPPGHHAEPQCPMGFCLFNNVGIAAMYFESCFIPQMLPHVLFAVALDPHMILRYAKAKWEIERIAIVDFDVHHGNGTQYLFENDPSILFASSHEGYGFYPGTGHEEENTQTCVNVELREYATSEDFKAAYSDYILPSVREFAPEVIFISAGFDGHKRDPLASIQLEADDYKWVTDELCNIAEECSGGQVISVLEGGYNISALTASAIAHVGSLLRHNGKNDELDSVIDSYVVNTDKGVGSDENETGLPLNPDDIQLVMTRTCCSQSKAIECLEGSNGNVVMAITLIEMENLDPDDGGDTHLGSYI